MKNFQRFATYFGMLKDEFERKGLDEIQIHVNEKKEYYRRAGITDPDAIRQMEHRKTREMNDRVDMCLRMIDEYGSVYEIQDEVMRYILLNKPPHDREILKRMYLPFKSIFIETEITKDDVDINIDRIQGVLISQSKIIQEKESKEGIKFEDMGRIFIVYYLCVDNNRLFIDEFKMDIEKNMPMPIIYDDNKTKRFLERFIINFLMFINDPDVELVHHRREGKSAIRRAKKGKLPLPSSRVVRLTGKLKLYVDGLREHLTKGKYSFRFWVRGHTRLLKADRYTHKKGKIIRIEPFLKGEGVLLKRTYSLDFEKKDERAEEVREDDVLKYEEIKPKIYK